ncbi:hypothetical protein RN607_01310 [Demequina capsici]|uniref:Uncharacterized protein n=1 Tax=Demequina capsici TaxID=3075620 RepID=A0AA96JAJ6_9MICO|nr:MULTISPECIES: hypothetical protein [unclassified Demequina]WNM24766.1 hypothetical protein RN606_01035 [Demequina sp. OYTSA14]WNM27673.1 hypothetical protein RN607_01310 [Demequina sp. PMTSA13]
MSDAPRPEDATAADDVHVTQPGDVPTDAPTTDELADAVPAVVRHAPRFARILVTGAGTPAAVGFLLGALLPNAVISGRIVSGLLVALGFGVIGGVISGVFVATADQRASAKADAAKQQILESDPAVNPFLPTSSPDDDGQATPVASQASASFGPDDASVTPEEGEAR